MEYTISPAAPYPQAPTAVCAQANYGASQNPSAAHRGQNPAHSSRGAHGCLWGAISCICSGTGADDCAGIGRRANSDPIGGIRVIAPNSWLVATKDRPHRLRRERCLCSLYYFGGPGKKVRVPALRIFGESLHPICRAVAPFCDFVIRAEEGRSRLQRACT